MPQEIEPHLGDNKYLKEKYGLKKTPLKRAGKKTKEWYNYRVALKKIYRAKGIMSCELRLDGCMRNFGLSFAHKHKRVFYNRKPELLKSFNETLLACASCHNRIEYDKELTEEMFKKLRDI